ncbi:histidine phosphatase family protein [Bacillus sp. BRMEA1]|uniref:histidine phosphatase family protein n=1 Tax=Neobacillus endophyticus TaxID=2738405 RepID=UPI001564DB72|nr:histidine phosphatase family protein [Neobacillus endophyticus]NRD77731.1 histidine phosphatase family protein [Neobacillus endophyticus]
MLTIYLTRHGETQWNKENRLQGWEDSNLTEKGMRDASALGERLLDTDFQAIYSSSSGRAVHTSKLVCLNRKIPIFLDDDLREMRFGEWEGRLQQEIEQNDPKEYDHFWNAPQNYNHEPHNGESFDELKRRVGRALNKIMTETPDGNVMIVTHGVAIRAILSLMIDIPMEKWWDPPFINGTSLTIIKSDRKTFQVELLGDISHVV